MRNARIKAAFVREQDRIKPPRRNFYGRVFRIRKMTGFQHEISVQLGGEEITFTIDGSREVWIEIP